MKGIAVITKYLVNRKINLLSVLSVAAVLLLTGCGGGTSAPASTPTTASTPTSTTAHATLKHVPSGMATVSLDPASQSLTVKISLIGLAPSSKHPAHIHAGSCAKEGGPVVHPLQDVVADEHGVGTSTTVIQNVKVPASGWYINVHNGPGLSPSEQFLPIVCSDLNLASLSPPSSSLKVPLDTAPPSSASETASGTTQLTLSGSTLTVKLTLSGLAPKSSHAAHIHSGSCESQGAVVHPLSNVVADASGNATVTTTINNVSSIPSSGWYVNVHYSTDLSTQTGFNPIACGNVTSG
jgi:CHRD domain